MRKLLAALAAVFGSMTQLAGQMITVEPGIGRYTLLSYQVASARGAKRIGGVPLTS